MSPCRRPCYLQRWKIHLSRTGAPCATLHYSADDRMPLLWEEQATTMGGAGRRWVKDSKRCLVKEEEGWAVMVGGDGDELRCPPTMHHARATTTCADP